MDLELREKVMAELERAGRARRRGNEGQARVCARRAAGWSLQAYYRLRTGQPSPESALSLLRWYRSDPTAPEPLRRAAERLTARVTEAFRLPHAEDPLRDACHIVEAHLGLEGAGGAEQ
ncbi:MAG TPA: hypothetical protein VFI11_15565 [Anaerolineales bacterium]|nr:hypothetical protein [Anaerolineales bacterium]